MAVNLSEVSFVNKSTMRGIADAIREHTGLDDRLSPAEMEEHIRERLCKNPSEAMTITSDGDYDVREVSTVTVATGQEDGPLSFQWDEANLTIIITERDTEV